MTDFLKMVLEKGASDLHLVPGSPAQLRIDGRLRSVSDSPLSPKEVYDFCVNFLSAEEIELLASRKEYDFALEPPSGGRFRVNLYREKGVLAGAFRPIPEKIPSPEKLGLPASVLNLTSLPRGLVLVTGPTGSGKSTSLTAMIDKINVEQPLHIITIEDPIEFVHEHKKSVVSQREIGRDSANFSDALKYVLRQDPDVILVGEMRDLETVAAAITISETGHLVFATLHTNSAVQTINRIIDVFPPHQQPQIRTQLSFILEGVVSQQLVPKIGGGRILALEIMIPTLAIRHLIREDKIHQIAAQMQMGQEGTRMQTMDQCLAELVKQKVVLKEEAEAYVYNLEEFQRFLNPVKTAKFHSLSKTGA